MPKRKFRDLDPLPDSAAFDERFARLVDAQLVDAGIVEHASNRLQEFGDRGVGPKHRWRAPMDGCDDRVVPCVAAHRGSSA